VIGRKTFDFDHLAVLFLSFRPGQTVNSLVRI
jgi:hypothetical protein